MTLNQATAQAIIDALTTLVSDEVSVILEPQVTVRSTYYYRQYPTCPAYPRMS